MSIHVNVDNFARAETDRMFRDLSGVAGVGVRTWLHRLTPPATVARSRNMRSVSARAKLSTLTWMDIGPRFVAPAGRRGATW